jgi:hypothetical protein
MLTEVRLRTCLTAVVTLWSLMATAPSGAQVKAIWRAQVFAEKANVYAQVSRDNPVMMVLNKGDFVDVVLEVSVLTDRWCRVAIPEQSEPAGFVLCKDLIMRRFETKPTSTTEPSAGAISPAHKKSGAAASTTTISPPSADSQSAVLRNKDVVDMASAGLPPGVLIAKIKTSACEFDTSPEGLKELKSTGVDDSVILAMVEAVPAPSSSVTIAKVSNTSGTQPSNGSFTAGTAIPPGSKVFIEPLNGFEIYLSAAFQKKKVPLSIINDKEAADFTITGASDTKKAGWAKIVFMGNLHSDEEASITMVNNRTGAVAFAYAVNKKEYTTWAADLGRGLRQAFEKSN